MPVNLVNIIKLTLVCTSIFVISCRELKDKEPDRKTIYVTDPVYEGHESKEQGLNVSHLIGKWSLDFNEIKKGVRRVVKDKKNAQRLIEEFDNNYKKIGMEFFEDGRYRMLLNDEEYLGFWSLSSDKLSYNIQMSDDFYELHEVISLTDDTLIELPVAQMRIANVPVKQLVFRKKD